MKTQIIYEDKDMLVCFKPAGLAVQSGRASEADMVSELKNYLAAGGRQVVSVTGAGGSVRCGLPSKKAPVYLGVIHRLDQPVSGILVFAKNQRAAASLSRQAADHVMEKTYYAVVPAPEGKTQAQLPQTAQGKAVQGENSLWEVKETLPQGIPGKSVPARELTDYMVKEPNGGARIADPAEKGAKKAQLFYRCLEREGSRALLEIELKTGRHHQIRVQLAHAKMPILGDNRYGSQESRRLSQAMGIRSIQLQAVKLSFLHPTTGKRVCFALEESRRLCLGAAGTKTAHLSDSTEED